MQVIGDVKCYHCGHVSGEVEGTRTDRLVLRTFRPRPGYKGEPPRPGQRIRCERCSGPVFVEDIHPVQAFPTPLVGRKPASKRSRSSRTKAA